MKLLSGVQGLPTELTDTVATIGNFDGVHLGHQALINKLQSQGIKLNLPTLVILFEPQPSEYFKNNHAPARISSLREKLDILQSYGVDFVCCLRFDAQLSLMRPEEFAEKYIFSLLRVRHLLVGDDFRFGHNRAGDVKLLQLIGEKYQAQFEIFSDFTVNNSRVSSTLIRQALALGDLTLVRKYLGRDYSLCGRVVCGDARGRQIGIPTANIRLNRKVAAIGGVFCVNVRIFDGRIFSGVANVGNRPTVDGKSKSILEVHLFNFDEFIYGEMLQVFFVNKLRDEIRFSSFELLVEQIHKDVVAAKDYFNTNTYCT